MFVGQLGLLDALVSCGLGVPVYFLFSFLHPFVFWLHSIYWSLRTNFCHNKEEVHSLTLSISVENLNIVR